MSEEREERTVTGTDYGRLDSRLLDDIPADERAVLLEASHIEVIEADTNIVTEGDEDASLILIIEGTAVVIKGSTEITNLKAGDVIGEQTFCLPEGAKRTATVKATSRVRIRKFHPNELNPRMDTYPVMAGTLWRNVARILSGRLKETTIKLAALRDAASV